MYASLPVTPNTGDKNRYLLLSAYHGEKIGLGCIPPNKIEFDGGQPRILAQACSLRDVYMSLVPSPLFNIKHFKHNRTGLIPHRDELLGIKLYYNESKP